MEDPRPAEGQRYKSNIVLDIVFLLLTCGLYGAYWQYRQMCFINAMAGEPKFHFGKWLLFTALTCTLYHHYHEYVMGREIVMLQERLGVSPSRDLPALSIVLSIISFGFFTDAIQQHEINRLIEHVSRH